MPDAGQVVLTSDGSRALDANGNVRLYNAAGECDDCCWEVDIGAACAQCNTSTSPAYITMGFSGLTACSGGACPDPCTEAAISALHSNPFAVPQDPGSACEYTMDYDVGCSDAGYDYGVRITGWLRAVYNDVRINATLLRDGYPRDGLFNGTESVSWPMDCRELEGTIVSDHTSGDCRCGGYGPTAYGGTADYKAGRAA